MTKQPLFALGRVVATQNVLQFAKQYRIDLFSLLVRHHHGDWGTLSKDDREANQQALIDGLRILSSYAFQQDKVWIITEADRSITTILLPEDY